MFTQRMIDSLKAQRRYLLDCLGEYGMRMDDGEQVDECLVLDTEETAERVNVALHKLYRRAKRSYR
jgi:Holliday junction resolvase RusA-like endonuclease